MGVRGIIKFFSMRAIEAIVVILLITFAPNLPPDAKYSLHYDLTPVMPFEGPLTLNEKLQSAEIWHKGDFHGPEAFAVYNGELYTTIHGGNVVKLIGNDIAPVVKFGKPCKGFHQEHICGRPLGLMFDKNGGLYVADSYYGIFKVDVKTGKQFQLVSMDQEINGKKPKLPNSVAVASNGDIYWTDSSTEFYLYDGVFDMLADGSGRLIHYDAKTKKNTVLIDKVHFANGIKLAEDESFVITTETARCRVLRYYLKGPKKGTHDVFLDGLPGLPDNIQTDGKDGFIIPLVVGRDDDHPPPLNILGPFPLIRKFFSRILGLVELGFKIVDQIYPAEWAERGIHYIGHFSMLPHSFSSPRQTILHISKEGQILDSIHSLDTSVLGMSEAFIYKDMLYMGSPFNDHIGRIPLAEVGWEHLTRKESDYPSSTTETPKTTAQPSTEAPSTTSQAPTTPPPSVAPKVTEPSTTVPPKVATPSPTQAPKVTTTTPPPPTQAPKVTTTTPPPTTQPPKVTTTTPPPPTQAPKVATTTPPPATQPPKVTTTTTQAPKPTTAAPKPVPSTQPPKATPTPTEAPKPTQAPKVAAQTPPTQPPKVATPTPTPSTPSTPPPKATTPSPAQPPKTATPAPATVPTTKSPPPTQASKETPSVAPTQPPKAGTAAPSTQPPKPSAQTTQTPPASSKQVPVSNIPQQEQSADKKNEL